MNYIQYVDKIAPEHDRTSCSDEILYNAAIDTDDYAGRGRCYRCTLLQVAKHAKEDENDSDS